MLNQSYHYLCPMPVHIHINDCWTSRRYTNIHTYDYVDRSRITSMVSGGTKYLNQLNYKVFKSNNDNAMHACILSTAGYEGKVKT